MTKNGIEYDLQKSPYWVESNGLFFYFSSQFYKDKFSKLLVNKRFELINRLFRKFSYDFASIKAMEHYSDILLYCEIEKRGFLIRINGEDARCLNDIIFDGTLKIKKNLQGL